MDTRDLQEHIDKRFDALEDHAKTIVAKLDGHAERITRNEARLEQLSGFSKILVTILIAVGGFFANAYFALTNVKH